MLSKKRGSLVVVIAIMSMFVVFPAEAATYMVGGAGGWTYNVVGWPKGKHFKTGDTLVFKYDPSSHNVVKVKKDGYNSCAIDTGAGKTYQTGKDWIKLMKGPNYFICNFPGHCEAGMKIAVIAA